MKFRAHTWLAWIALGAAAASGSTMGCSSGNSTTGSGSGGGSGGGAADPCFDYASFNGSSPKTTFKADVLPIFRRSCGLSESCHGPDSTGVISLPPNQPYLGPPIGGKDPSPKDIAMILGGIIDQPAQILKGANPAPEPDGLKIVNPSHPESSFMMSKLEAVLNEDGTSTFCSKLKCETAMDCGNSMPQDGPELAPKDTNTIRLWIAQGAKND
jgi:hypothetical protein